MSNARKAIIPNADFLPKADLSPSKYKTFSLTTDPRGRKFLEDSSLSPMRDVMFGKINDWLGNPAIFNPLSAIHREFPRMLALLDRVGQEKASTPHARHIKAQALADRTNALIVPLRDAALKHAAMLSAEADEIIADTFQLAPEQKPFYDRIFTIIDRENAKPDGHLAIRELAGQDRNLATLLVKLPRYVTGLTDELHTNLMNEAIDRYAPEAEAKAADAAKLRSMAAGHDQVMMSVRASFGNAEVAAEGRRSEVNIDE